MQGYPDNFKIPVSDNQAYRQFENSLRYSKNCYLVIDFNNTFLISDQPTTCPKCGARTDFYDDTSPVSNEVVQIHTCLSPTCKFEFVVEFDEELDNKVEEE